MFVHVYHNIGRERKFYVLVNIGHNKVQFSSHVLFVVSLI